ncbi:MULTISPECIES: 5'-nucleotidase, lipoprotein e(P4) family [Lysobacteraceae]|nr:MULTISPECIES: 5'-nucleotidase, lipoprotein e(P4) family [Lysobacter]
MRPCLLAVALSATLAACATTAPVAPPANPDAPVASPAPAGPAADDSLNATAWFQTAAERDLVYTEVYRAAGRQLRTALADKAWDALPKEDRNTPVKGLKPAIIVDVDETVLDNAPNNVRQIREGRGFDEAKWGEWVAQRAAKPLPGAVEFLQSAAKQGVTVFYITNRDASLTEATIANLRSAGFPVASDDQVLGLGTVVDGCEQEGSEKSCRRQLVGRTHRVVMQFGDQVGDFVQILGNTVEGRKAAIAPYADWIGERWWVLPNPMYGSWEPALFDNNWRQPEEARRAAKEAALDDAR